MKHISNLIVIVGWIAGIVLAKGWLTVVAILVPFYAWYLVLERAMIYFGWI